MLAISKNSILSKKSENPCFIFSSAVYEDNPRYCHSQLVVRRLHHPKTLTLANNFCNIEDSNLIFGMHV